MAESLANDACLRMFGKIPSVTEVVKYRAIGAQLQTWIDDPDAPGCTVDKAKLEMQDLTRNKTWKFKHSPTDSVHELPETERVEMRLPGPEHGAQFQHMELEQHGTSRRQRERKNPINQYKMTIGEGFIASHLMYRGDGPHWNEIARAFYRDADFRIETLRYVTLTSVVNDETAPLVMGVLYPRRSIRFGTMTVGYPTQVWPHGTREYQEILGTQLGKAVAYLILSSFPRGTRRISQVRTWSHSDHKTPSMTFVIENAS
ncbi:hypothetical protein N7535_003831 [Penicillium sp. DV-2018c]|nr:hypothetical protein N7535_003831 [Penicillium sp. DV-2018c]